MLDTAISKARWRLLPILIFCFFAAFLDRINVGVAALQMNHDLGLTATEFGIGAGAFFITYILCEIPSNLLLTHFGAKIWITRIMLTWALFSAATAFAWNAHSFYVVRMFLGAAEAGFFPGVLFYLTQWFPRTHRARITATFQIAVPVTTIIGAPLSVFLLQFLNGAWGLQGWKWLFLIEAMPAAIMAFVIYFCLPNGPKDANWLTSDERDVLIAKLRQETAQQENVERFTIRQAIADKRILLMCLIGFGNVLGITSTTLWLPQIIKKMGETTLATGFLTAMPALAGLCALLLCAWNADRAGERVWHVAGPYFFAAAGFLIAALSSSPAFTLLGLTIGTAGIMGAIPSIWALPAILLTGTASATAFALINSFGSIGGFVGPIVIGKIREATGSFSESLLLMACALALTAGVALLVGYLMRENLRAASKSSPSPKALQGRTI